MNSKGAINVKKADKLEKENIAIKHKSVFDEIVASQKSQITKMLQSLCSHIIDQFLKIFNEMCIYRFIARYVDMFDNICYPVITDSKDINVEELENVYLHIKGEKVVPNNVAISSLTAIYGENSAGKSAYMKSIGIAILFSQKGLPIPCKSARLPILKGIYGVFATSELSLGRFEEEVKSLSNIYYEAEDSIIMLNEVFQSTDYNAASKSYIEILKRLAEKNKVIVVTHIFEMEEYLRKLDNAKILFINKQHRLVV